MDNYFVALENGNSFPSILAKYVETGKSYAHWHLHNIHNPHQTNISPFTVDNHGLQCQKNSALFRFLFQFSRKAELLRKTFNIL